MILTLFVMIYSLYQIYVAPSTDIEKVELVELVTWSELTNSFENNEALATERFFCFGDIYRYWRLYISAFGNQFSSND